MRLAAQTLSFDPLLDLPGSVAPAPPASHSPASGIRFEEAVEREVAARTAELQSRLREADAFAGSAAHDLRAPLRAIKGFSLILEDDFAPQLPAEARAHLDTISSNVREMEKLIEALLTLSRADHSPLVAQPVLPRRVVDRVLHELKSEYSGRNVQITIGALPACRADATLLAQVWVNLLANAIKFTRDRDPAVIEIGARTDGGRVTYFVRDNGAGFDMRCAHRLFGPFSRLHAASEYEGTGIGLSIARRIIRRHGGEIRCEAQPGHGATFLFTLEGVTARSRAAEVGAA